MFEIVIYIIVGYIIWIVFIVFVLLILYVLINEEFKKIIIFIKSV